LDELELMMTLVELGCDSTGSGVKMNECKEAITNSGQQAKIGTFVSYDDGRKVHTNFEFIKFLSLNIASSP
jgi:hypothetical protein